MLRSRACCSSLFGVVVLLGLVSAGTGEEPPSRWPAPKLTDESYSAWLKFIRPTPHELKWRDVRWHKALSEAAAEARQLQRPILLWAMNGHPCGET